MKDKILDLIENLEIRQQVAIKDGNNDLVIAYNRVIGELYEILKPSNSNPATITVNGVTVEVYVK